MLSNQISNNYTTKEYLESDLIAVQDRINSFKLDYRKLIDLRAEIIYFLRHFKKIPVERIGHLCGFNHTRVTQIITWYKKSLTQKGGEQS